MSECLGLRGFLAGLQRGRVHRAKEEKKKSKEKEREATGGCGQGERREGGAQRYQSQSRLATEILVFQIKPPNLDK